MGQYQQWLFAQEVERRLKVERETLETELLYLQDRITILEQSVPEAENMILQALQTHLRDQASEEEKPTQADWGDLPRVETPLAQTEEMAPHFPNMYSQMERSRDMLAFFDRRGQTDAKLSAWPPYESRDEESEEPLVDEETRRLNENIQRWFIRWHQQITGTERSEEVRNE